MIKELILIAVQPPYNTVDPITYYIWWPLKMQINIWFFKDTRFIALTVDHWGRHFGEIMPCYKEAKLFYILNLPSIPLMRQPMRALIPKKALTGEPASLYTRLTVHIHIAIQTAVSLNRWRTWGDGFNRMFVWFHARNQTFKVISLRSDVMSNCFVTSRVLVSNS